MRLRDVRQLQLALLPHAQHRLHLRLSQREQPRGLDVLDRVDLDGHAAELLLLAALILLVLVALGEGVGEDGLVGVAGGMRDLEDLFGTLPELVDLALDAHLFYGVLDLLDIDHALVGEGVEEVVGLDGLLPALLVPEDQVDPLVQVVRHVLGLQGFSVDLQVGVRVAVGPLRDLHVRHLLLVLPHAQVQVLVVLQEGGVREVELGNELFERSGVFHHVVPVVLDALEQSIRLVEPSALQLQHVLGLLPDQIADDVARRGVMAAVHELRRLHALVPLQQALEAVLVDGSDGLAEVPVDLGVVQVQLFADVIGNDPGEDGILGEIGGGAVAGLVQVREVVEVGDLAGLPLEGDVFELVDLEAADGHSLGEDAVDAVPIGLVLKGEVVVLVRCYLEADLS